MSDPPDSPTGLRLAVEAYLQHHDVPRSALRGVERLEGLVEGPTLDGPTAAWVEALAERRAVDLAQIERIFEAMIPPTAVRRQGAVYTPTWVADALVGQGDQLRPGSEAPRVFDPACGSGGMLVRGATYLMEQYDLGVEAAVGRVGGIEKSEAAADRARSLLALLLVARGGDPGLADDRVVVGDSLLDEPDERLDQLGFDGRPDLLVTNPPYVKIQRLSESYRRSLGERWGDYLQGSWSLSLLFALAGLEWVGRDGIAAQVTQNNLMTSVAGRPVRTHLKQHESLRRIVDFGHHQVFDEVTAYTCLLFLGRRPEPTFEYTALRQTPGPEALEAASFARIEHRDLEDEAWRLAEEPHLTNLRRLERTGIPLGSLAEIHVGLATLKDACFFVDERDGAYVGRGPDGEEFELEAEVVRPAIRLPDVGEEGDLDGGVQPVLFPYEQVDGGRPRPMDEEALADRYPRAYAYLEAWRRPLMARDGGNIPEDRWFAWGRNQSLAAPGPKLLTKTFNRRPAFWLDDSDRLFANGYSLTLGQAELWSGPIDLPCLQRILNSRLMHYYAKLTSFQLEGDYQCYQKNFIERLAIPQLDAAEVAELKSATAAEVDRILARAYGVDLSDLDRLGV